MLEKPSSIATEVARNNAVAHSVLSLSTRLHGLRHSLSVNAKLLYCGGRILSGCQTEEKELLPSPLPSLESSLQESCGFPGAASAVCNYDDMHSAVHRETRY
jgi:hypothetical protein